jgi:hypothetical protein
MAFPQLMVAIFMIGRIPKNVETYILAVFRSKKARQLVK